MAEPKAIIADPISSDGSEESWILLDEMDEAMNEEFNMSQVSSADQSDSIDQTISTETLTDENLIEEANIVEDANEITPSMVEEIINEPLTLATISSEALSLSNDEEDEDIDEDAHLRSVLKKINALRVNDDDSTTDGSISIIGDHENNQGRSEPDDVLSSHTPTPQPMQMWLRCTPIDMTICAKRPLEFRPRNYRRCAEPTSVEELGLPPQNIIEDVLNYLDRLNNLLTRIYLVPVLLFFLAAGSLTILYVLNGKYTAGKLEIKQLEQKLYSATIDRVKVEGKLAKCEYLYEMELEKASYPNTEFKPENGYGDKTEIANSDKPQFEDNMEMPAVQNPICQLDDPSGECVIQPTRLSDNYAHDENEKLAKTVWTGAGDEVRETNQPTKENKPIDCNDENSLFSEYNRRYCESHKKVNVEPKPETNENVYSTLYSYKTIDDKECNLNQIDFNKGIEHARKILRDTNCDDEGTLKYLQEIYDNFQTKTKGDQNVKPNRHNVKIMRSQYKRDKTQKIDHIVIENLNKYDENSSEERFDHNDKKHKHDKKHHKENDSDKENKQKKHDRKDAKKQEKDQGKRNKNDRKRDMAKVYDHRHDD